MAKVSVLRARTLLLVSASALLLASCGIVSGPGTYPNANGPRDGDGFLIDPVTGAELPGQANPNR